MTTDLILYDQAKTTATIAPALQARKSAALEKIEEIQTVTSQVENDAATVVVQEISDLIKGVEKQHDEVKAPYWAACKAITGAKNTFLTELETERTRVNCLCGNYVQEQLEIQRESERERARQLDKIEADRRAEEARIENERIQAEAAKLAETQRIEAEAAAKRKAAQAALDAEAAAAKSKRAKAEAAAKQAEFERQLAQEIKAAAERAKKSEQERVEAAAKAERERAEREAIAAQEAAAVAPVAPVAKASGQVIKAVWTFEVINILSLAKVRPDLVKMEPRTAEINELINSLGVREMAGLRIFEEVRIGQRKPSMKILDV